MEGIVWGYAYWANDDIGVSRGAGVGGDSPWEVPPPLNHLAKRKQKYEHVIHIPKIITRRILIDFDYSSYDGNNQQTHIAIVSAKARSNIAKVKRDHSILTAR